MDSPLGMPLSQFKQKSNRPIVSQANLHIRTKPPRRHFTVPAAKLVQGIQIELFGISWRHRRGKTGAETLAGIRREGELGNKQDATGSVGDAAIHTPCIVGEYPIGQQLIEYTIGNRAIIVQVEPEKHQQASLYLADALTANINLRLTNALQ